MHGQRMSYDMVGRQKDFRAPWGGIVEQYTKCGLTRYEDKLIALSGVISSIQERSGYQCVAGLWKQWLHYELVWAANMVTAKSSLFPSWSWASCIDSRVEHWFSWLLDPPFIDPEVMPRAHIIDIRCWTENEDSKVKMKGLIRIRCGLWEVETGRGPPLWDRLVFTNDFEEDVRSLDIIARSKLDIDLKAGTKAYALLLLARRNLPKAGLVVRRVITGGEMYERVGM